MKPLDVGDLVTVLDREHDRAVHAVAKPFFPLAPRRKPFNLRVDKDGKLGFDGLWAFADGHRVRGLFPEKEGLNWCRGHVDGSALEAAWKLAKSAPR